MSKAAVALALQRGGTDLAKDLPALHRALQEASAADRRAPTLVLEGTASIDPLVLSAGEVARAVMPTGGDAQKFEAEAVTRKGFFKSLLPGSAAAELGSSVSVAASATPAEKSPLLEHAHAEGLSFYETPQDEERRVNGFYMGINIGNSGELYAMNPAYGHLHFVDPVAMTRGGEFGEILRLPFASAPKLALVPTFRDVTKKQWDMDIRPVMACIQNQMPLAAVDFYANDKEAERASLRTLCRLPAYQLTHGLPQSLSSLSLATLLERQAQAHVLRTLRQPLLLGAKKEQTGGDEGVTMPFTVPAWAVRNAEAMQSVVRTLDAKVKSGQLLGYQIVSDQPLLYGEPVITIVTTLPTQS